MLGIEETGREDLRAVDIGVAIDQASTSALFAVAFLSQATFGAARKAIDRLMERPVVSYGLSDKAADWDPKSRTGPLD